MPIKNTTPADELELLGSFHELELLDCFLENHEKTLNRRLAKDKPKYTSGYLQELVKEQVYYRLYVPYRALQFYLILEKQLGTETANKFLAEVKSVKHSVGKKQRDMILYPEDAAEGIKDIYAKIDVATENAVKRFRDSIITQFKEEAGITQSSGTVVRIVKRFRKRVIIDKFNDTAGRILGLYNSLLGVECIELSHVQGINKGMVLLEEIIDGAKANIAKFGKDSLPAWSVPVLIEVDAIPARVASCTKDYKRIRGAYSGAETSRKAIEGRLIEHLGKLADKARVAKNISIFESLKISDEGRAAFPVVKETYARIVKKAAPLESIYPLIKPVLKGHEEHAKRYIG